MPRFLRQPLAWLLLALVAFALLISTLFVSGVLRQVPAQDFAALRTRVEAAGSYRLRLEIEQTLLPRATPAMIGQQEQHIRLSGEGAVALPDRSTLTLRRLDQPAAPPISLLNAEGRSFVQQGDQLVAPAEQPAALAAPSLGLLAYLDAASDVTVEATSGPGAAPLRHYRFRIDGERLIALLAAQQGLAVPQGALLADRLQGIGGTGELWVDGGGLPIRQLLVLNLPVPGGSYDAQAHIDASFADFGGVEQLLVPRQEPDGVWRAVPFDVPPGSTTPIIARDLLPSPELLRGATQLLCVVLAALGLLLLWLLLRRARYAYLLLTLPICALLAVQPALLPGDVGGVRAQAVAAAEQVKTEQLAAQAVQQAQQQLQLQGGLAIEGGAVTPTDCGRGSQTLDSDDDGLSDFAESCLGTDFDEADSDGDAIGDGDEVTGFSYAGQTWTSDPLKGDTNGDGVADTVEWPFPYGLAVLTDTNTNNIPDLWDLDNDGDGVEDNLDLAPQQVTSYRSNLALRLSSTRFLEGATYVDVQLQPQNPAELRYGLSTLDWPLDSKGQVTDLDNSPNDLRLVPMLEITTTVAPALAARYGAVPQRATNGEVERLLVPLSPVEQYGQVSAFSARVAYLGDEARDVTWDARLVWVVQAQVDSYVNCGAAEQQNATNCTVETNTSFIQTYAGGSFRLTGLDVSRSRAVDTAIFGVPRSSFEGETMLSLLGGLSETYLSAERVENQAANRRILPELAARFNNPGTPPADKFTITDTVVVAQRSYVHSDEATSSLSGADVPGFLDANAYAAAPDALQCPQNDGSRLPCAMLALAIEQDNASAGLPASDGPLVAAASFGYQLDGDAFVFSTLRSLKLGLYTRSAGSWQALTLPDALASVNRRYDFAALAREAQSELPGVTAGTLRTLTFAFFLNWLNGTLQTSRVDGESQLYRSAPTNVTPLPPILSAGLYKLPILVGTLARASQLFEGTFIVLKKELAGKTFVTDDETNARRLLILLKQRPSKVLIPLSIGALRFLIGASVLLSLSVGIANVVCPQVKGCDSAALRIATISINAVLNSMTIASTSATFFPALAKDLAKAKVPPSSAYTPNYRSYTAADGTQFGTTPAQKAAKPAGGRLYKLLKSTDIATFKFTTAGRGSVLPKILKGLTKVGKALGPLGLVVELGLIWGFFGSSSTGMPGFALKAALATAIVSSIFAIAMFALSFVPGGNVISAIIGLIDSIIQAATGGQWSISRAITEFFYTVKLASELRDIQFVGRSQSGLGNPALGMVAGNRFLYSDIFSTTFIISDSRAISATGAFGSFSPIAPPTTTTSVSGSFPQCVASEDERTLGCTNSAQVAFDLAQPQRNLELGIQWRLDYSYAYLECVFFGRGCISTKSESAALDKADQKLPLTIDVLPATLSGFLNWREISNPDPDGDGLINLAEEDYGTNPNNWDSDNDGLSDGYELGRASSLTAGQTDARLDPRQADSDNDGLADGDELRRGTNPVRADSDDDGLNDGAEVIHLANGRLVGGWTVVLPGTPPIRVAADPQQPDADGDGLNDLAERANSFSPAAANDGPQVGLNITPQLRTPDGLFSSFARPGGEVRLDLALISGGLPVTSSLELCLPAQLRDLRANALTRVSALGAQPDAAVEAVTLPGCATAYRWALNDAQQLQLGELVSTTLTARLDPALNGSEALSITASTLYSGRLISATGNLVVDADLPSVEWSEPEDGAILRGQQLIVGGTASDATSGLARVEVRLPGSAAFSSTTDLSPWAASWALPEDGVYTLEARAVDGVGQVSPVATRQVTVDNTAPTVATSLAENAFVPISGATDAITLTGSANDNLSGVARVQLSIDGRPWQELTLPAANQTASNWSYVWPVDRSAQGTHRLALRAYDRAGNLGSILTRTIIVDTVAPANELTTRRYGATTPPIVQANTPLTLTGYVNDAGNVPLPLRPRSDLLGGVSSVATATVWLEFPRAADSLNSSATWLGDVNGDGLGDLAVGSPNAENGAGRITVVYGRGGDWRAAPLANALADSLTSFVGRPDARLGTQIAPAGDLNGDGLYDMLVGDAANNRVFVVWGRVGPLGRNTLLDGEYATGWATISAPAGTRIGTWQSAAGDVNGDGFDDLLIGATPTAEGAGQLLLVTGQGAGRWPTTLALPDAATAIYPFPATGSTARGVGDVNGDGLDDWALLDSATSQSLFLGDATLRRGLGAGPLTRTLESRAASFALPSGTGRADLAALGDMNGDALDDFVYRGSGGVPRLVLGRTSGAWADSFAFDGYTPAFDGFVVALGDLNADGLNDLLLGGVEGEQRNAYLFYGARSLPTRPDLAATFSGVASAASAPYAAGSDLNCDASSDLLLVPIQTTSDGRLPAGLSYGALPQVDLDALPQARANGSAAGAQAAAVAARLTPPTLPAGAPPVGNWLYVDDDYCPQCTNDGFVWNTTAFSSLQSALNAATSNTQIVVRPGVYGPAQVQATATLTGNLWITGVNPDAVFLDGDGASDGLVISSTVGGGVLNLTIRNTQRAIVLRGVGTGGDTNPAQVPIFDRLLLLAFREAGLAMDRASSADVRRTTFAGSASATSLFVDPTPVGPPPVLNWTQAPALPAPAASSSNLTTMRGQLYAQLGDDWRYYRAAALPNGLFTQLPAIPWLRNSPTSPGPLFALTGISRTNELVALNGRLPFETVVTRPQTDTANGNLPGIVYATARDSKGNVYIGGDFRSVGGVAANYIAVWSSQSGQWLPLGSGFDAPVYALAVGAGDRVYAGGAFTRSGDGLTALNKVAVLNGTLWQALAGGFDRGGPVYALAVDTDGTLLAGGAFDSPLYYDPPGNTGGDPATSSPTCDAAPDQIALYQLPNFNAANPYAWCQVLDVGEYINLAAMDAIPAGIASIRLGGLLRATLYIQENLTGPSATFPRGGAFSGPPIDGMRSLRVEYNPNSTHRLARWNPTTQAWTGVGGGVVGTVRALEPQVLLNGQPLGEPGVYVGGEIPVYDPPASDTCDANPDQVALYDLVDFNRADPITPGDSACQVLAIGDYANLALDGSASSLRVGGRVEVQLYQGPNFTGGTLVLRGDDRDLASNGFDNLARSARVRLKPALHNVRRWTGTAWAPLGPGGINGPVYAIKNLGIGVYIGGSFSDPGSNIISWRSDLQLWETLLSRGLNPGPAGVNGPVYTIGKPRFDLLVGGAFTQAGGGAAPGIAIWNFSSWGGVDFGARNGIVRSMSAAADQPELLVGGETLPGSRPSNVGIYDSTVPDWRPLTRIIALNGTSGAFSGNFYRALPGTVGPGLALAPSVDNPNDPNEIVTTLYALSGGGQNSAYRLQIGDQGPFSTGWQPIAPLPTGVITGSSLAWANGALYALLGGTGQLYRYTPQSNSWLTMTALALPGGQSVGAGAALTWDGGDSVYAVQGGGTRGLFRYSINENRWRPLADLPVAIGAGGGLVFVGGRLFFSAGGGSTARYSSDLLPIIPIGATQPTRLVLRQAAFVAPASLAAPNWSNVGPSQLLGFGIRDAGENAWLGGSTATWAPTVPTTATLTVDAARFLDPTLGLYRVRASSPLRAGYSLPAPDAVVAPDFGPTAANDGLVWGQTAFNSIQAAIDAGALRITLRPGRYQEPFSLASGVELVGAGADSTLLTLPLGSTAGAIIDAGGVQGVRLSNLSIVGNGPGGPDGLRAAGAQLRLARSIVRNAAIGVQLRGATTRAELVNLTLANNRVGVEAQAAPLDLRNSLLAFHTTAALSYTTGPTLRYPFNAFWQNAANYHVNGVAQEAPQAGVVVVDPRLSSPEEDDFRPLPGSSLLGSGSPADPTPPGTGGRVDIGYLQQGRAALYVDDDYCDPRTASAGATCDNDGLEWGVDAFNRIQPALDAARVAIQRLDCSKEASSAGACSSLAVGVAPGSYSETLTLSSRIALVGSGADRTILTGAGAAPVVAIDNAFQVALRGLSIVGGSGVFVGGAARDISLERLLIRGGSAGVQVNGGAGVQVAFTTFAAIGGPAVLVEGARSQAEVSSSILTGGPSGLRARTGGRISSSYNLLNTTLNYDDGAALPAAQRGVVERSDDDLLGTDPRFVNAAANDYRLLLASPAVDSANPFVAALAGGGERTDRGYAEVEAIPLAILPGKEGVSCQIGNSGAAAVEVAAVLVPDATQPTTATLPSANVWQSAFASAARPTAAYWSGTFTPPGDGLYRLYGRARDAAGNSTGPNFLGSVAADGTPPTVEWRVQPPANLNGSAVAVSAQASDYLNVGGVWQFTVDQIAFEVVVGAQIQTYSADWDDTGWDVVARTPRRFQATIPLPQGASQLRAVARDQAGNRASTALITVQATNSNSASFVEPTSGAATAALSATISGSANFANGPGAPLVVLTRSGNNQPTATFTPTLATPGQTSSAWNGVVELPADGVYTLTAQAARGGTLGTATDVTITRDSVLPTLAITPVPGVIGRATTLTGSAGDALSGLAAVEISADGGTTWDAAIIDGATWRYNWSPPVGLDGQAVTLQARARDRAGNVAVVGSTVAVDTLAPTLPDNLSFGLPERSYLDLDLNETLRVDGLTAAVGTSLRLLVDSVPTTTMTATSGQLVTGPSINVAFPRSGRFYLHLAAVDTAGNVTSLDIGPYFVGTAADLQIQLDGQVDRERGEWLATMRLDDDERPQPLRTAQELYWAADDAGVYLGWQGAQWALDGSLVAYLGTGGGTSTPLADTTSPTLTLPFVARYAVVVSAAGGTLYEANGSNWTPSARPWRWVHDPNNGGGTEIALPFLRRGAGEVRLLALTLDEGKAWSLFPTTNLLNGPWTTSYQLTAQAAAQTAPIGRSDGLLSLAAAPLAQRGGLNPQPRARNLTLTADASPPLVAASATITYLLTITSNEANDSITPVLQLTGTGGLRYTTLAGLTCGGGCPAGGATWTVPVPNIAPGATRVLTITGQAPATTALTSVTSTLTLNAEGRIASNGAAAAQIVSVVDGAAPEVSITSSPTPTIAAGRQILAGLADDGFGAGVERVELRLPGSNAWQVVSGTTSWVLETVVPSSATTYAVAARATDRFGATSTLTITTFTVDAISPTAQLQLPTVVSGTTALITGTAQDPFPLRGDIALVEVQIGAEDAPWQLASALITTTNGVDWRYAWPLPSVDSVPERMRVRATDAGGNLGLPTTWQTTTIDTVAPLITGTEVFSSVTLSNNLTSTQPVLLRGEVTDGGSLTLTAELLDPTGALIVVPVERTGTAWEVRPRRGVAIPAGSYRLLVQASDQAGNLAVLPPINIAINGGIGSAPTVSYLPLVVTPPPLPDLVVEQIKATNAGLEVVIRNQGDGPATTPFWVELYLNPTIQPTRVNQIWPDLGAQGAVWGVTRNALPLEAKQTLTLRLNDAYFGADLSDLPTSLTTGAQIFVQVDSASTVTSYGAVFETHELVNGPYNNIGSIVVGSTVPLPASSGTARSQQGDDSLPARPNIGE